MVVRTVGGHKFLTPLSHDRLQAASRGVTRYFVAVSLAGRVYAASSTFSRHKRKGFTTTQGLPDVEGDGTTPKKKKGQGESL